MWGDFPPAGVTEQEPVLGRRPGVLQRDWGPATILAIADKLGMPGGVFDQLEQHFPNARIVVIGYPYLFPDGQAPLAPDLLCASMLRRVDQPDRTELRYLQNLFNDAVFEAAVRQGVDFITPTLMWEGHEPCGAHGQWTNSIEAYASFYKPLGGSAFHPNSAGQHALAALVSCYLKNLPLKPKKQQFATPANWLTPPSALSLAGGAPFPSEWGTKTSDFNGCSFPKPASASPG